ncbi:NAD(P)/FAD-dependent oxidoreductase [Leifsonia virtsii]|uniref:NAD(P)/FAD-dependent oxidoreductase n=1 Tax=Leifsonia virtsii TaxID=3035915 RepID=A0ABT8IY70_9MICO|nr:NAD(P)/FAD-dependent oxidoreductase [Leifsonia virtsii]MDN4597770.1 NAD(P)/FAD-dependent oxidoreductase [Leifsonia virtsii]
MTDERNDETLDALVIGGGAAGLNGALMLARSRRTVVVVDAGEPRNAPAEAVHGLLARDGTPPAELLRAGREEVHRYGGRILNAEVADAVREPDGFAVALADGRTLRARRLLVATGVVDVLPDVPGLAQHWGHDVVHCPYCHGWEVRDRAIGILAIGETSMHQALLFRQLSDDVVYFENGHALGAESRERLAALDVPVVADRVTGVESADDRLAGVRLEDGRIVPREVLAVATRLEARVVGLASLSLPLEELPGGMGMTIRADAFGRTEVPGVWVAGNASNATAQVGAAAAAGALAGAQLNADLATEDADRAVERRRRAGAPATAPVA